MAPCPMCRMEMAYVSQYGQYYCHYCQQYQQPTAQQPQQPQYIPPPGMYQYEQAEEKKSKKVIIIIAVVLLILVIAIPVALAGIMYLWVSDLSDTNVELWAFPTIEVELIDNGVMDELKIKHIQGEPLDWSEYNIVLTNNSDPVNVATLRDLSSLQTITVGDTTTIDTTVPGFKSINYELGLSYTIEFYNTDKNKIVYTRTNLICL